MPEMFRSLNGSQTELERPFAGDVGSFRLAPGSFSDRQDPALHLPKNDGALAPACVASFESPSGGGKWDGVVKEASIHLTMIIAGWSDASSGPLIPYIQAYYGISYTVVSMLFVGQMVGFLTAAFTNGYLSAKFGLGKVISAGALIQALGFVFLIPAFPFPVMPICYAVIGFGLALQDAQANTYIASLPNADHKFAFLHASYGLGAVIVPLAATAFVSSGTRFSYFYSISIGIALLNVTFLAYAFKFNYRVDDSPLPAEEAPIALAPLGTSPAGTSTKDTSAGTTPRVGSPPPEADESVLTPLSGKGSSVLGQTLRSKVLWLFSFFILLYVGSEVSMGGWIVTFVIDNRQGGPSAGYIATGYWGGLLVGRLALSWVNVRVGQKKVLFGYLGLAIALEFAVMFANDLVGNAVTVALIGVLMGPSYPIVMSIATKVIPRQLHSSAMQAPRPAFCSPVCGFIAAFGQLGAAIFPFATGALSQRFSPAALQPVMIVLLGLQGAIWIFVPSINKKRD